jgi:hypothetical protein
MGFMNLENEMAVKIAYKYDSNKIENTIIFELKFSSKFSIIKHYNNESIRQQRQ